MLLPAGIPPAPRRAGLSWKQLLRAHAQSVIAADFFCLDTIFFKRLHVLFFIHLATRRILAAACAAEPTEEWVTQQARDLAWKLEDDGIKLGFVIHDRDRMFAPRSDMVFKSAGTRVNSDSAAGAVGELGRREMGGQLSARGVGSDADP